MGMETWSPEKHLLPVEWDLCTGNSGYLLLWYNSFHLMAEENSHFIVYDSLGQEFGQNLAGRFSAARGIDWDSVARLGQRVQEGITLLSARLALKRWKAGFSRGTGVAGLLSFSAMVPGLLPLHLVSP